MNISYELLAYRGDQAKRMNSQMQVTGLETPLHPTKIKKIIIKKTEKSMLLLLNTRKLEKNILTIIK